MADRPQSTSASRMRKFREKKKVEDPSFKANESKRIAELRKKKREQASEKELAAILRKQRDEKRLQRAKKRPEVIEPSTSSASTECPYKSKQALYKAINKALRALPQSPRKKKAVVTELARKMNIALAESSPSSIVVDKDSRFEAVKTFYYRPDIVYTCPGVNDFVTIWENATKKKCQKHYLTLYLREAFAIFKEVIPDYGIGFSKFCSLRPKNVLLMKDTPSDQCRCVTHENFTLKLKGLKEIYSNDWWNKILCEVSMNSLCWKNECDVCSYGKKVLLSIDLSQTCVWKEWDKNSEKKLRLKTNETSAGELKEKVILSLPDMMHHVNLKRIQAAEFQQDKLKDDVRILQVDFAMSFGCEYQNEIQSALWSRSSVMLFTAASFYKGNCQTYVICSDTTAKDKDTIYVFLNELFDLIHREDESPTSPSAEIIWSDGPASEFKNRYMVKLTTMLSGKHEKTFFWKYFATSHGKGVIDGVGGNIKRLVREKMMSQDANVVIQSAKDFADLASRLVSKTRVIYIPASEISQKINAVLPWQNTKPIPGISNFHYIKTSQKTVECRIHSLSDEIKMFNY